MEVNDTVAVAMVIVVRPYTPGLAYKRWGICGFSGLYRQVGPLAVSN